MVDHLPSLSRLLKTLQQVPYLASKNLYRVATHFLSMDEQQIELFCDRIREAQKNISRCPICCTWVEQNHACYFCSSPKRDHSVICVVESWQELLAIEKTGGYKGMYHILGGALSPLDGIDVDDLTVDLLLKRIASDVKEIILAMNQTPEGEATSAYIAHKLKGAEGLKITCLARGVPVGSSLEYMDRVTVYKALSERRPF
ncbi:recombination protein RecR [Candidatus Babeliales bacterium]|nr:recombination protein RecR [Candidatus Babeliales bacterium]